VSSYLLELSLCILFLLSSIIYAFSVHSTYYELHRVFLAYADDVNISGRKHRCHTEATLDGIMEVGLKDKQNLRQRVGV
jgi:hypothetical protein